MTAHLSFDQIKSKLDTADQKDQNIRIKYQVQSCVELLDMVIQNDNGQVIASVFHKPTAEPYILPYTSDHPRHVHRNIPYAALVRAARIWSNVHDFTIERIRIDMSLLLNDYPPAFITKHISRFFDQYNTQSVTKQLNEHDYYKLHQKLLHQQTRREKQLQAIPTDNVAQMLESLMRKRHGIRTPCMLHISSKVNLVLPSGPSFDLGGRNVFVGKNPKLPMSKWNSLPRVIEHWNHVLCTRSLQKNFWRKCTLHCQLPLDDDCEFH